jgi:glutaredoxin
MAVSNDHVRQSPHVVLYTRQGCHLCDDVEQLLLQHGLAPTLVDIDVDPALRSRFDTTVPVVEIDGRVRFRGRVEPLLLRRILRNLLQDSS